MNKSILYCLLIVLLLLSTVTFGEVGKGRSPARTISTLKNVTVVSPNGGENWHALSQQNITWTSNNIENIKIEYTFNNGTSWIIIVSSTPTPTGSYTWTIPNTPSTQCKVRISDVANSSIFSISSSSFTILPLPSLTLTSPTGGESLQAGTIHYIQWQFFNINNLKIDYTTNNGNNWTSIISSNPASTLSYAWTVPNTPSTQCKIRISDLNSSLNDQSDTTFTIYTPYFTFILNASINSTEPHWNVPSPGGSFEHSGVGWLASTASTFPYPISGGNLRSVVNTSNDPLIAAIFRFSIPVSLEGNYILEHAGPNSSSNAATGVTVDIVTPFYTNPNPALGDTQRVMGFNSRLSSSSHPFVQIGENRTFQLNSGGQTVIRFCNPAQGTDLLRVDLLRISRVSPLPPNLSLISPNGGEIWYAGSQHNVNWSSNLVTNVKIEYSTNNGNDWNLISSSIPASLGSYTWTIPNTPSTQCKVRITDTDDSSVVSMTASTFSIIPAPTLNITSPVGGESWQAGVQRNLTWTSSNVGNIRIEYSTNNGTGWNSITSSVSAASGSYTWNVPNTPSTQCKVRLTDISTPSLISASPGAFTILPIPSLTISSPTGGEGWQALSQHNINWNYTNVANIKIEYSSNNGTAWSTVISSTPASAGSYLWTVPNTPSTQCKVRISDVLNSSISSTSNSTFSITSVPFSAQITADSVWLDPDFDGLVLRQVSGSQSIGNITLYEWFVKSVMIAQGVNPTIELRTGDNWLKLKVTNNLSQIAYDSVKIKVYSAKAKTGGGIYSGVSQIGNLFYITSMDKGVYRFDSTGTLPMPFMTGGSIQSTMSISSKNLLYVGSDDTRLYCFDVQLNSMWDKSMGGVIKASPSITTDGNTIYIGTNNGYLKALDANNGNPKWTFNANGGIISSPTLVELVDSNQNVIEKIIYFGTENGVFFALKDKETNYENYWSMTTTPDSGITSSPAISSEGMLYFGSKNGYLYRVNWDGEYQTTWKKFTGGRISSSPLIGKNDLVYVASESGYLYGFDKEFTFESNPLKQFYHQWGVNGTPSIGKDGNLYIGCNNGTFYKLEDTEGNTNLGVKWSLSANSGIESPILATESGLVVVGCTGGDIYIMKDLSANIEGTENLNLAWPTFKGNNKRNKVTRIVTAATGMDNITALPSKFNLSQNYPNPFNPSTVISYELPVMSNVSLKVFDMIGNEVATLVNEEKPAGYHTVKFNAENISTGVYFYRLQAGEFVSTKKLLLVK